MKLQISRQIFDKYTNMKFHVKREKKKTNKMQQLDVYY